MKYADTFCRAIRRANKDASLEELIDLAMAERDAQGRKFTDRTLKKKMRKIVFPPKAKPRWSPTPATVREALKVWTLGDRLSQSEILAASNSDQIRRLFRGEPVARTIRWLQR